MNLQNRWDPFSTIATPQTGQATFEETEASRSRGAKLGSFT